MLCESISPVICHRAMHTAISTIKLSLIVATNLILLSACNWVDSTGTQSEFTPPISEFIPPTNATISGLRSTQPLALQEELALTTTLLGRGAQLRNWTWAPAQSDTLFICEGIEGFDTELAATTLTDACADAQECSIVFIENSDDNTTQFTIRMPQLQAPVALSYSLSTTTEDGGLLTRQQPLCGISVNEAPLANDDNYLAVMDERRLVSANDSDSLLANDTDDVDIRNQALQIDPTPVQMPRYATEFALGTDGSFIYRASNDAPINDEGFINDSFVYSVSDGLHSVEATAVVKIVNDNREPRRRQRIPDLEITIASLAGQGTLQQFDLSKYFFDPDGDPLRFSIREDLLPVSGNISINPAGLLIAQPGLEDLGLWQLTIIASDGLSSSSDAFNLNVLLPEQENLPPTAEDIGNRIVQNTFSYDVSVFFNDPNDDPLSFSATGLPSGVSISETGIIQGEARNNNLGVSIIQVTANDNRGGTVTDGFALVIN